MSFKVQNPKRVVQMATDGASTYYVGQLVAFNGAASTAYGTVTPLVVPSGVADTSQAQVVAGVVVGINNRTPTYSAAYKANYIVSSVALTQAELLARDVILNKGMYAMGEPQVLLDVAVIDITSLIEGPIFNAAYGTAPTVVTATAASATGLTAAGTTGACDFTPVDSVCSIYCRSGENAGLYRTTTDISTTAPACTVAFPQDVAIGDTFVRVPLKQGLSYIYITDGMYIDASLGAATNYFTVIVEKLDLRVANQEKALFRFTTPHFNILRA